MAFTKTVTILGDKNIYQINPTLKKYALTDIGFVKNNAGTYVMQRALEPAKGLEQSIKFKVAINETTDGFKMKVVNASGNTNINIFKASDQTELVELLRYYLDELVSRNIITIN
ncbi:DUF1831 domain-containing protein [Weissella coleopterorum]|uniref:DUF1831 domain-containing protein n=1 Tax=Weissella coleopterorum TaxID=2714949 RepID=A0A6G8B0Z6_9LACO|nr:DUF1831 domain-containing protein [Weissella coleopterorum]QIL50889.1 DUF1831 domain-containing protein [Weissella coleopterorum]